MVHLLQPAWKYVVKWSKLKRQVNLFLMCGGCKASSEQYFFSAWSRTSLWWVFWLILGAGIKMSDLCFLDFIPPSHCCCAIALLHSSFYCLKFQFLQLLMSAVWFSVENMNVSCSVYIYIPWSYIKVKSLCYLQMCQVMYIYFSSTSRIKLADNFMLLSVNSSDL